MRIAVFGGSFDPPHLGHQQIVQAVLARNLVDEVWLLPVKHHPFAKNVSSASHRLAMLQLMLNELADPRVKLEEYELHLDQVSYTFDTLTNFRRQYPEQTFLWLMGSDQLPTFNQWSAADQLVRDFPVWVYPRAGYGWEKLMPGMTALTDFPVIDVSSTQARAALAANQDTTQLVLPSIAEYSRTQQLYEQ